MSLFASLNLARLALGAHQTAIQTTGQNIANANTEGYARQRVELRPTPADDMVFARLGTGVAVDRIERIVDEHLEGMLREARAGLGDLAEQDRIYSLAESVFNDLDGGGLSVALGRFFEAMEDLANQPEDPTTRTLFLEEGSTLGETLRYVDGRVRALREGFDEDTVAAVEEVNRLTTEIAALNRSIVHAEDGGVHPNTANDLRTQRDLLLGKLSDLVEIRTLENSRGAVQVLSGSDVLVFDNHARELTLTAQSDGDILLHRVRFAADGSPLSPRGGRIAALLEGRDTIAPELRANLDSIAGALIGELNRLHTGGEGLARYTEVRALHAVGDRTAPLSGAGYPFPIEGGSFSLQVMNEGNDTRETYVLPIDLDGVGGDDTSLDDLVTWINSVVGAAHPEIQARVTIDGYLEIESTSSSLTFTFRDDDSGFLAAAGIHTLFEGASARDIEVNRNLIADPALLSTGRGGGAGDNSVVIDMLGLRDAALLPGGTTFEGYYTSVVGRIGVRGAEARDLLQNQEAITNHLENQRQALSGVNIDEEAISLIRYQRAYQGAARFLTVVDRLLETLINSV